MKRVVWIVIAVAVLGYFLNSHLHNKRLREADRAEAVQVDQATTMALSQMATGTNAIQDWAASLCQGDSYRMSPVLTLELERLWLTPRPILFVGGIRDIATHDDSRYAVLVERSVLGNSDCMFATDLQLSVLADKNKIDSFLKEHPDLFKNFGLSSGVTVVAKIGSIRTIYQTGEEGERLETKVGDGDLVDILYTGHVMF